MIVFSLLPLASPVDQGVEPEEERWVSALLVRDFCHHRGADSDSTDRSFSHWCYEYSVKSFFPMKVEGYILVYFPLTFKLH